MDLGTKRDHVYKAPGIVWPIVGSQLNDKLFSYTEQHMLCRCERDHGNNLSRTLYVEVKSTEARALNR